MQLSALLIRAVLLLLPGSLASRLYRKFRGRSSKKLWEDIAEVLLFCLASYVVCASVAQLPVVDQLLGEPSQIAPIGSGPLPTEPTGSLAFQAFFDENIPINWREVGLASIIGTVIAFIAGYVHHYRLINKFARLIGASNRTDDEDIWDFFHNSPQVSTSAVYVRDHQRDLVYHGFINAYSESREERELVLLDVDTYTDDDFQRLYHVDAMYVSRPRFLLTIEVPTLPDVEGDTSAEDRQDEEGHSGNN